MKNFSYINEDFYDPENENNVDDIINESMSWQEKYAREVAAKYGLCYNDDDTIEAERTELKQIKAALTELRAKHITCSNVRFQKIDKLFYILVDF